MIVLDSSILVGIIKGEPDSDRLLDLLATEDCAIGAPTLVEARAWCAMNLATHSSRWLEEFIEGRASSSFRSAVKWQTRRRRRSPPSARRVGIRPS